MSGDDGIIYSTSRVAEAAGVHPNTVRLYEEWKLIPPVPRGGNGYRQFREYHLWQMCFARKALEGQWAGRTLRSSVYEIVYRSRDGDLAGALTLAENHLGLVRKEQKRAEEAAAILQRWASGEIEPESDEVLLISEVSRRLNVSADRLRSWERNRLLEVPRHPSSGYRLYGSAELERLKIIRMLLLAGYSTMAVLRMMSMLDEGQTDSLREILNTPHPDEDVYTAFDEWLTSLKRQENKALELVLLLEERIGSRGPGLY